MFGYCIVSLFYLLVFYSSVLGRTFVYNENHEQKLAGSFKEYEDLLSSGLWYAEKPKLKSKKKIVPILTNPSEVA